MSPLSPSTVRTSTRSAIRTSQCLSKHQSLSSPSHQPAVLFLPLNMNISRSLHSHTSQKLRKSSLNAFGNYTQRVRSSLSGINVAGSISYLDTEPCRQNERPIQT